MPRAETQSTERKGIFRQASLDGCTNLEEGEALAHFRRPGETGNNYYRTTRCSRGVCETAGEPAAAKGESMGRQANQAA